MALLAETHYEVMDELFKVHALVALVSVAVADVVDDLEPGCVHSQLSSVLRSMDVVSKMLEHQCEAIEMIEFHARRTKP